MGYLRDDNSLVTALPRSLPVRGPSESHISGARLGREFVASHVWRHVRQGPLASRTPLLNSFVPNLVWLPSQVAKLTDQEGGVVQTTLQAMSRRIYRTAEVLPHLRPIAEEAWDLVPDPTVEVAPFDGGDLNWFCATDRFFQTRAARLRSVIEAVRAVEAGDLLPERVVTRAMHPACQPWTAKL